jgi:hypothetical protein
MPFLRWDCFSESSNLHTKCAAFILAPGSLRSANEFWGRILYIVNARIIILLTTSTEMTRSQTLARYSAQINTPKPERD